LAVKIRERPKGSGTWWVFIDHNGKRKAKKIGRDKKVALDAARKIAAKLTLGEFGLDREKEGPYIPTFKQYVYGWIGPDGKGCVGWLEKYGKLALKSSTRTNYENILKTHILSELGDIPLDRISPRLVGDLMVKGFNRGLRSKTVKNIKNCLGSILGYAYQPDGYIYSNPATGIKIPRPEAETPAREPSVLFG